MNAKAKLVEAAFVALLERLTPKPERMELIEAVFRNSWTERNASAASDSLALRQELGKLEARKQRVLVQMADGVLSEEDFASLHKATTTAMADIRARIDRAESSELDLETSLGYLFHLLWNTCAIWQTSDLQGKQRIQRRIFPMGVAFDKTGFGTPVTHSIYTLLGDESVSDSVLVAPQGFMLAENKRDSLFFS